MIDFLPFPSTQPIETIHLGLLFLFKVLLILPRHTSKCGKEADDVGGDQNPTGVVLLGGDLFRKGTMVLRDRWKNQDASPMREPVHACFHHYSSNSKGMRSLLERSVLTWLQPPVSNEDSGVAKHVLKKRVSQGQLGRGLHPPFLLDPLSFGP